MNSVAMEPKAFKTMVKDIKSDPRFEKVYCICTDNHPCIEKALREVDEEMGGPNAKERKKVTAGKVEALPKKDDNSGATWHGLDNWHVTKNMSKALEKCSKSYGCHDIALWIPSIVNHLWYSWNICHGNSTLCTEIFLSLLHHVRNIHDWKTDPDSIYQDHCEHHKLTDEEVLSRPWLRDGSDSFLSVQRILSRTIFLKQLEKGVLNIQTGSIESFNAKIRAYLPKRISFGEMRTLTMTRLCIMSWNNSNAVRQHAQDRNGNKRYRVKYSKGTGKWTQCPIYWYPKDSSVNLILFRVVELAKYGVPSELKDSKDWPKHSSKTPKPSAEEIRLLYEKRRRFTT